MFVVIAFLIIAALIISAALALRSHVVDGWEDENGFHRGVKP